MGNDTSGLNFRMTYVTNLENRVKEKETASRKIAQQSIVDKKIKLA